MHAFLIQRWVDVYHSDLVNQEIENGDSLHQFSELFPRGNLYTYVYDFFLWDKFWLNSTFLYI